MGRMGSESSRNVVQIGERRGRPRITTPGLKAWVLDPSVAFRFAVEELSLSGMSLGPGPVLPYSELQCNIMFSAGEKLRVIASRTSIHGKRQGLRFCGMGDDDAIRLEAILQHYAPWVRWEGRVWIAGDVELNARETASLDRLSACGFSIDHDSQITHLPDDATTTDVIVSARTGDLEDAVLEVRSALPRRRVIGHDSSLGGAAVDEFAFHGIDPAAVCSACHGSEGLVVTGRLPLVCNSCLAVNEPEPVEIFEQLRLVS